VLTTDISPTAFPSRWSGAGTEVLHAAAEAISARCTFRDDARASATYRAAVLPRAFSHAVSECLAAISDNGS